MKPLKYAMYLGSKYTIVYTINNTFYCYYISKIKHYLGWKTDDGFLKRPNKLGFCVFTIKPDKYERALIEV